MPKDWILVRDTERDEVKSRCLVVNDWSLLYKNAEECGFKVVFFSIEARRRAQFYICCRC